MILIDGGYIQDGNYYYYLTDHLGNNRVVADASGKIVQKTHYEPFGKAFEEEGDVVKEKEGQPYLYNGKELYGKHGLNLYDYATRLYNYNKESFDTMDGHAENYYSWSPYAYVGNNPMKYIDPTGMDTVTHVRHGISDDGSTNTGFTVQAITATEGGERSVVVDNPLPQVEVVAKDLSKPQTHRNVATAVGFSISADALLFSSGGSLITRVTILKGPDKGKTINVASGNYGIATTLGGSVSASLEITSFDYTGDINNFGINTFFDGKSTSSSVQGGYGASIGGNATKGEDDAGGTLNG